MSELIPYVCIYCRSSFKRPFEKELNFRPCAKCGRDAVIADIRFRPPKKSDEKQWKKVEFLFNHGFYFQKVYRMGEPGVYYRVPYPSDLNEAKEFVQTYKEQAIKLRNSAEVERRI